MVFRYGYGKWLLMISLLCTLLIINLNKNYINTNTKDSDVYSKLKESGEIVDINNVLPDKLNLISDGFIDEERISLTLWSSDEECKRFKVQFGKNLSLAYLVSYPRSGNTWVRYLIEAATGLFTGSVYNRKQPVKMGETENHLDGTVIIVKTHDFQAEFAKSKQVRNNEIPIVLLIRNPLRSILSYWNWKKTSGSFFKSVKAPWETNQSEEFVRFTEIESSRWKQLYSTYLTTSKNLLPIFYENVVENPVGEVEKIVKFLGFQTDPQRLACVRQNSEGPAKRNHSEELYVDEEMERSVSQVMRNVLELLLEKGINPPSEYEKVAQALYQKN